MCHFGIIVVIPDVLLHAPVRGGELLCIGEERVHGGDARAETRNVEPVPGLERERVAEKCVRLARHGEIVVNIVQVRKTREHVKAEFGDLRDGPKVDPTEDIEERDAERPRVYLCA